MTATQPLAEPAPPPRSHIVIAGSGRAGTTFLVELLTHLGLDTGFSTADLARHKNPIARAGLEHDIRQPNCPRVVKSPWFGDHAQDVLNGGQLKVEHLFVPVREMAAVAASRRQVQIDNIARLGPWRRLRAWLRPKQYNGGLVYTRSSQPGVQEALLERQFCRLLLAAAAADVPTTLLHFPRLVEDAAYLHRKLQPVLEGMRLADFRPVFERVAQPALVHRYPLASAART